MRNGRQARQGSFCIGKVVSVNSDGSINIRKKGSSSTIRTANTGGITVQAGDSVSLGQYEGDPQKVTVLGFGGYYGSDESDE